MTIKRLLGVLARVALSVIFAGIFYIGWMAIALPTYKSGFGGLVVRIPAFAGMTLRRRAGDG